MNLPDAPIAHEGFFATHFFTVRDQEKSLALWDLATVPTGKTPHPVAVELFVQFALAHVFMNDFAQCTYTCQA